MSAAWLETTIGAVTGSVLLAACVQGRAASETVLQAQEPSWTLVWSDEFDGDALDATRWKPEESCWGGGNQERQCYTARPENVSVAAGALRLTARHEAHEGPLYAENRRDADGSTRRQPYTSGKVRTLGLADWTYGRFSARMKLPRGQGTWPAFWMMPSEEEYGDWPLSGEIDVMEAVNQGARSDSCEGPESRISGAIHFGAQRPGNAFLTNRTACRGEASLDEWHVYTVEWGKGLIQWFVDGEVFMRAAADDWYTAAAPRDDDAPFDRPFYVMLNLAVGGAFPENENEGGVDDRAFPASVLVDWVLVEQCQGDLETGRACMEDVEWDGALERGP